MERKRDDQSSLLPTKIFHPRISVNTRSSGIFLTECLLSAYNFPSVFNAPAVHFTRSVHPSPPQADASAAVTCASELAGASCKSRTGCVLWQQNFVVQCKDQLTISLIYATLALLLVFSHKLIIKQKDEQATPFFRGDLLIFFIQLPCAILQQALFILSGSWGSRHTIPARRTQKP